MPLKHFLQHYPIKGKLISFENLDFVYLYTFFSYHFENKTRQLLNANFDYETQFLIFLSTKQNLVMKLNVNLIFLRQGIGSDTPDGNYNFAVFC